MILKKWTLDEARRNPEQFRRKLEELYKVYMKQTAAINDENVERLNEYIEKLIADYDSGAIK